MNKIVKWIKKNKFIAAVCALLIVTVIVFGIPIIINFSFVDKGGIPVKWDASDYLIFYGSFLSFIGTIILGSLTICLNVKINKQNIKHQKEIEQINRDHAEELLGKQHEIENKKDMAEIESWKLMAKQELENHYENLESYRGIVGNDIIRLDINFLFNKNFFTKYSIASKVFQEKFTDFYKYYLKIMGFETVHSKMKLINSDKNRNQQEIDSLESYPTVFEEQLRILLESSEELLNYLEHN